MVLVNITRSEKCKFQVIMAGGFCGEGMVKCLRGDVSMKRSRMVGVVSAVAAAGMLWGCQRSDRSPGSREPYTMTMVIAGTRQSGEARIEEKINEILLEELNMKLDLVILPWESQDRELRLMLTGDEKIDCFYTGYANAIQYMKMGQIVDLSRLVKNYGTNLKRIFREEDLEGISVRGFVFGVPAHCEGVSVPAVFLRKDLVEKYRIDVTGIHSPKDLEPVFDVVSAGEPGMTMLFSNGSVNGPLYRLGLSAYDPLGEGIGVLMNPAVSTEVVNLYETQWYHDTASMLYEWYKKGYISQEAATENRGWDDVFQTGEVFAMITGDHPGILSELESSTGYEFVAVDFAKQGIRRSNYYGDIIYCIAQNSEDPDRAMQCLDYIYGSEEIMNLLNWGVEGTDYVFADEENRLITFPEGVDSHTADYSLNLAWELPNQYLTYLWEGSDPEVYQKTEEANSRGLASKAFGFLFDSGGLETQEAAVKAVCDRYVPSISSGSVDPEEYLPGFVEELKAAGVDDIIKAKQEQLDAWLLAKKEEEGGR